ncbi:restriction endonuclease subunit S [Rhizobium sp. FY34]|uniref:restriction endonuclease subunit S n=1 Tax=Rhizobium sp. FY34 TaxID=2562309 RepID=UPI0010BFBF3C|nr:restriction endonuclease subunit S [Rhizobium sp. FY34]
MKLSDLVEFNPSIQLRKGTEAPFIEMAALPINSRDIGEIAQRTFNGSGSKFQDGDTLFARITPCLENGKGGYVSGLGSGRIGHGSTEFIVFRPLLFSDTEFVYYLSRLPHFRFFAEKRMSGTSGRQRVAWQSLADYELVDVHPAVRTKVGRLLGALDDKIELNRRTNEMLEAMAQAIFRDWFVDFGPTRRKLEGATDPFTIIGGLVQDTERTQALADLFPAALGDDGLPEGWSLGVASALVEFNPKEPLKKGTPAPYSDMSSLPTSGPLADPPVEREYGSGMRFRNGDALLARITPCLENGKSAFVDFLPDAQTVGWGSTEFYVLRSRKGVPAPFAYLLVRHPEFRAAAIASMTGTSGRQRAQVDRLEIFPFVEVPMELLSEFGKLILPMFNKITANGGENRTLAATRDLLLPKLMSGEIRLSEAEDLLEAAQ